MSTIACIVEGDGEVKALPILLRRIAQAQGVYDLRLPEPIRVRRDRFLSRDEEFRRMLTLADAKAGSTGAILVLLDADDDCPAALAAEIARRAAAVVQRNAVSVVLANREYEAWFLASIASLAGCRGLKENIEPPAEPESIRDAKGWLGEHMSAGRRYHPVADQPALTALFDLQQARAGSRSMRKLMSAVAAAF